MAQHLFALWFPSLSSMVSKSVGELHIIDTVLITRIQKALRLRVGERCILFDRAAHVICIVKALQSKAITISYAAVEQNAVYAPIITALLPLLKKDDLSTAVAELTAVGVSAIQLIMTDGVQRAWGGATEYERLERVMIATAEQSKNFAVPYLYEPVLLREAIQKHDLVLVGDPEGLSYAQVLKSFPQTIKSCSVLVGPEADFSSAEKAYLAGQGVTFCALTPTVLRSHLALTIMTASVRAWYL